MYQTCTRRRGHRRLDAAWRLPCLRGRHGVMDPTQPLMCPAPVPICRCFLRTATSGAARGCWNSGIELDGTALGRRQAATTSDSGQRHRIRVSRWRWHAGREPASASRQYAGRRDRPQECRGWCGPKRREQEKKRRDSRTRGGAAEGRRFKNQRRSSGGRTYRAGWLSWLRGRVLPRRRSSRQRTRKQEAQHGGQCHHEQSLHGAKSQNWSTPRSGHVNCNRREGLRPQGASAGS